jgi:hypothetical protein
VSSRGRSGSVLNLARVVPTAVLLVLACVMPPSAVAASKPGLGPGGPLPLLFEPNQGQADPGVRFLARGRGYGLFLAPTETVLVLTSPRPSALGRRPLPADGEEAPTVVRMRLLGADPGAVISGVDPLPSRSHYLIGDRSQWRRDVPTFARVRYADVYPGVSLVFYGNERQLEYDFVVAPGADPSAVALAFEGADVLRVDDGGDLVLATAAGELRLRRPLIYQERDGERRPVEGGYVVADGRVRFQVTAWDASRPLVIDPVLGYSTYLGGSSNDQGFGIAVDDQGAAYVTGATLSTNFPISATPFQTSRSGVTDAFIAKLDPTGSVVLFSTFLGGSGDDAGNAIAVDLNGNVFVAGTTNSNNFPLQGPFQATTRGFNDAFVAKLDPSGSTLIYSTYIGSNTDDVANGIAIDALGRAYVTGSTASSTFPNNNAVICFGTKSTGADAYVLRLNAAGDTVDYCRFIGGPGTDVGQGIAADSLGNVWVVGSASSGVLGATPGAFQQIAPGKLDAFVGKLDPLGGLVYLTHLGGTGDDEAFAVAVDALGNAYVAGSTTSFNFPTALPFQGARGGLQVGQHDAFVSKLSPDGSVLLYSTYLGGAGDDIANGIAVNQGDNTFTVVGSTTSVDFPAVQALQAPGGRMDAFVTKFTPSGASLLFSTYLGGTGDDVAQAVALDNDGVAYVTGSTNSPAFPTQLPIQTAAGLLDAFVTQIADGGIVQFSATKFTVDETAGSAVITVQRTGDTSGQVTVDFTTSDGTATAGADYTAVSTTLTFVPGQVIQTVTVPILDDVIGDGDETVTLSLTNATGGAVLGTRRVVDLVILDNEPAVNFEKSTYTVAESKGPAIISVNRSGPTGGTVLVNFSTADDTAIAGKDYTAVSRTLTFGPGVRTQLVSIPILQDTQAEGTETVTLRLLAVSGGSPAAHLGVRSTAVLQITDEDDKGGNVQFGANVFSVNEPAPGQTANAVITVTRNNGAASAVMVDFQATDGPAPNGALVGTNYMATAGTLTFAAGQTSTTFTVPIVNDPSVPRGNPTLTVRLSLTNFRGGAMPGTPITATLNIQEFQANVAFTASTFTAAPNVTSVPITVRRLGAAPGAVTVSFSTTTENTTAVPDVDFRPVAGTLTFPASNTTLTFMVPLLTNPNAVGARTIGLALTAGTGVATVVEPRTAVLTIGQGLPAGVLEFSSSVFDVAENVAGGVATIGVIRSSGTLGGVTVDYATSDIGPCPPPAGTFYACAGSDYTATSGTLTFGQGETFKTFQVPIINDLAVEGVEALNLTLSNPGPLNSGARLGVRSTAQIKIIDDELAIGFNATNYTVNENGGSVTIKVELTGVSVTPVTVQYATSDGTATAGQDYVATSGTLTFAAPGNATGVRTQTFTIPILPDTLAEGTETINLTLSNPAGPLGVALIAGRSTAVVSIIDDDQGGAIEFDSPTFSAVEGSGVAAIRVRRTASQGGGTLASNVTVDYATTDGTATAGLKYVATAGRLTFAAGETLKTFTVPIIDNAVGEGDQTVNLRLSNPGGGGTIGATVSSILTIVDDDPYVTFSSLSYSVLESAGSLTVTVRRGGTTTGQVTVGYATADQRPGGAGKAVGGIDYTPVSGTLTFAPNVSLATFQVPILNNSQPDPDRKFDLLLSNATPGSTTILAPARAEVTITDDDRGGVVQFSAATYTVSETGGDAVVTVIRTGGSGGGVSVLVQTGAFATVPIAPTATATVDYTPLTTGGVSGHRVVFGTGETTKTVRIPILPDALAEGIEQFDVKLSGPCVGAIDPATLACVNTSVPGAPTIGPQSIAAVLIIDAQQTVQVSAAEFATIESSPAATLTVDRTGPPHRLVVDFNTADLPGACPAPMGSGRACANIDYRTTTGTLTFEPGVNQQRITVPLIDNQAIDIPRLFSVQLSNLRNDDGSAATTLGPRTSANVRIKEDDRGGAFSVTGGSLQETNGTTAFTVTISRVNGLGGPVSVFFHAQQCGAGLPTTLPATPPQFATACDHPAIAGVDFDSIDERIVFLPGETSKQRTIVVHGNAIPQGSRDIRVQLTEPLTGTGPGVASVMQDGQEIGATLGAAQQLVTIVEDDLYFVQLSSDSYGAVEGAREALITVIRSGLPAFINQPQDIDIVAVTGRCVGGPIPPPTPPAAVPVAGQDYVDLGPGPDGCGRLVARENPFRFNAGETTKIFRVPLLDDTLVDGEKEFTVYIRSAVGSGTPSGPGITDPASASLKISDDDVGGTIEFSAAEFLVAEDVASGFATITLARSGGNLAGQVTVNAVTVDVAPGPGTPIETAAPGVDYTPVSTTVTFNAGEPIATFVVPIINDGVADGVKTLKLQISGPQPANFGTSPILGTRSTALLHIVDTVQTVAFAHDNYTVDEGAGTATITLERTGSLAGVLTVNFATTDQTAVTGTDYTATSGTVTFAAGVSQVTVSIPIIDNTTVAADKTVGLTLSAPSAGAIPVGRDTATLTIKDDDKAGTIAFPASGFIVLENGGPAVITIVRTNGTAGCPLPLTVPTPVTGSCAEPTLVTFSTADGTATAPGDYTAVSTTVEFGAGETFKTVTVPIVNDGPGEGTETVLLNLSNPLPSGAAVSGRGPVLGALAAATLSIIETEFRIGATAYTVGEGGGPAMVTVVRVGDISGPASLDFVTVDGTAVSSVGGDFTSVTSGQLTFAAQEAVKTLSITLNDDSIAESDESFDIVFNNPIGATIARDSCATALPAAPPPPAVPPLVTSCTVEVNILDNEQGGTFSFSQPVFDALEPAAPTGTATITVRRTAGGAAGASVDYATGDDTALDGRDYDATTGTLSFGLGETIKTFTVTVRNGALGVRTANVFLQNATGGASIGTPDTATLRITDRDNSVGFSALGYTVAENGGSAAIAVRRTGSTSTVLVDFTTFDQGACATFACAGSDYTATATTLTFPAGTSELTVMVPITNDGVVESNETFGVRLSNPRLLDTTPVPIAVDSCVTSTATTCTASVTILDDDLGGIVQFSADTYQVTENVTGGQASIVLTRTGGLAGGASVTLDTTIGTPASQAVTFLSGQPTVTAFITITDNALADGNRSATLTLSNPQPSGQPGSPTLGTRTIATLNILDDEPFVFFVDPTTFVIGEGAGPAVITVARQGSPAATVLVDYAATDGTATSPRYTPTSNTLTFGPNVFRQTFPVTIGSDTVLNGQQTVVLTLSNPRTALPSTQAVGILGLNPATLTINDDDRPGTLSFSSGSYAINESAGALTVIINRSEGNSGGVSVDYAVSGGTAVAGVDFTVGGTGTVTFGANETFKTFTLTPIPNPAVQGAKTVVLTLSNATGTATLGAPSQTIVTILDQEQTLVFSTPAYAFKENGGPAAIVVNRVGPTTGTVLVDFSTVNGTATAPADYTAVTKTLTFTPGVKTMTVSVPIINDGLIEGNETFSVQLSNPRFSPPGAGVGFAPGTCVTFVAGPPASCTATVTIVDDDSGGVIQFSAPTYTVSEASAAALITLTRSSGVGGPVTVHLTASELGSSAGAGLDYLPVDTIATFNVGVTTVSVPITILNDTLAEGTETLQLRLSSPTGGAILGARDTAVLNITDNDVAGTIEFGQVLYTVSETAAAAVITVVRSGGTASGAAVDFLTADPGGLNGAVAGIHYTPSATAVIFGVNQTMATVTVPLAPDDLLPEGNKNVLLRLVNPRGGAKLGVKSTATLKILDNEATVQFASAAYTINEGGAVAIVVERTGTTGTVTVPYTTADLPGVCPAPAGSGRACHGVDYTTKSGTLTFNAGVTSLTISVATIGNSRQEGPRAFVVNLLPPLGGTAGAALAPLTSTTVTITDDDHAGELAFFGAPYRASELGVVNLSVRRASTTLAGPVTVSFTTVDGSAKAGVDYVPTAGTLTFPAGATTASLTVTILPNSRDDGERTFAVALSAPTGGATLGSGGTATVIISDDDVGGTVQFSAATYSATECATTPCFASLTLARTGGGASGVSVDFVTVDGTGNALNDYVPTSGTVVFNTNQTSAVIQIPLRVEPGAQPPKTFGVILSGARGGAVLGLRTTATVTVTDTR